MKAKTVLKVMQGLAMTALILAMAGQAMPFGNIAKGEVIKVGGIEAEVYFSPHGGAEDAIVREIGRAKNGIMVQAFSFTSAPIGKALVEAQKRGVQVAVILDREQNTGGKYTGATFLKNVGAKVFIDTAEGLQHNKVMVIDGGTTITGSFNFSKQAEKKNRENLLVLRSNSLAKFYMDNWQENLKHVREF